MNGTEPQIAQQRYKEANPPKKSILSKLTKLAQQRFKEAKLLIRMFSGDGKSDVTLTVWDFGGQKVRNVHGCVGEQLFVSVK